jgi:DNA replication protein DnaC
VKRRVKLAQEQFSILEGALGNDFMVARGGVGTGKTVMAWELARREAARGRSVLLLTLTDALGLELGRRGQDSILKRLLELMG